MALFGGRLGDHNLAVDDRETGILGVEPRARAFEPIARQLNFVHLRKAIVAPAWERAGRAVPGDNVREHQVVTGFRPATEVGFDDSALTKVCEG